MTDAEFAAWTSETNRSRYRWLPDQIHNRPDDLLCYTGGQNGKYIWIHGTDLTVGSYEGAVPHIGEALFREQFSRSFSTTNDACKYLFECMGLTFLRDLVTA